MKDVEKLMSGLILLHKVSQRRRGKADRSFRKARSFRERIHLELTAKEVCPTLAHTNTHTHEESKKQMKELARILRKRLNTNKCEKKNQGLVASWP